MRLTDVAVLSQPYQLPHGGWALRYIFSGKKEYVIEEYFTIAEATEAFFMIKDSNIGVEIITWKDTSGRMK